MICAVCKFEYLQSPYQRRNGPTKDVEQKHEKKLRKEKEYVSKANKICKKEGYKFLGLVGSYENIDSKIRLRCKNGHIYEVSFHSFVLSNSRCRKCAKFGFNPDKKSLFYLRKVEINNKIALKYGITNQLDGARESKQKRNFNGIIQTIFKLKTNGYIALEIEKKCKEMYSKKHYLLKEELPDGFTETVKYSKDIFEKIKKIALKIAHKKNNLSN